MKKNKVSKPFGVRATAKKTRGSFGAVSVYWSESEKDRDDLYDRYLASGMYKSVKKLNK